MLEMIDSMCMGKQLITLFPTKEQEEDAKQLFKAEQEIMDAIGWITNAIGIRIEAEIFSKAID